MAKKIKKTFVVTIEVDEEAVKQKYPNYRWNYNNPEELIEAVANDVKFIAGVDMSKDGMKQWGYSIKVKETKKE
jgi:hypothetical protein